MDDRDIQKKEIFGVLKRYYETVGISKSLFKSAIEDDGATSIDVDLFGIHMICSRKA